uniref:Uncharacterized protein orf277 n=1 Tax=Trebouxia aggregata TaxID=160068 RepID=G8XPE6_9CHLO|nr:hypothetical protein [Trebouxia aggregata]
MLELKVIAEEQGRLHQDYNLTSPLSIDINAFDTKGVTYFTNSQHTGEGGAGSGSDHAKTLEKGFGLKSTPESINRIYNKLCGRLLCPETDLYKVDYTEYGVRCCYISAFLDFKDPSRLTYLFHSWQTNYFIPEKEDLDALISRKGANFSIEDPFLDGWNRLLTLFCKSFGELKKGEKDFVRRRNLITDQDINLIYPNAPEASENWRIPNKSVLLANSTDWRKALPSIETGKNYGFVELPQSHCTYNPLFYSSDIFDPSFSSQEPMALLPYGDFYGID